MTTESRATALRPGVTGIVLAGGRSSRFGSNKLEALIDGVRVIDRTVAALASVVDEVIVAGTSAEAAPGDVLLVPDPHLAGGPLVGLGAGLSSARREVALVVGGDMPLVEPALLRAMVDRLEADPAADSVVLGDGADVRPLPMAIRVGAARTAIGGVLAGSDRSMRALLARLRAATIPETEWRVLDPDGNTLLDVDRPADLELARTRLAR